MKRSIRVLVFFARGTSRQFWGALRDHVSEAFFKTLRGVEWIIDAAGPGKKTEQAVLRNLTQRCQMGRFDLLVIAPLSSARFTRQVAALSRKFRVPVISFVVPLVGDEDEAAFGRRVPVVMSDDYKATQILGERAIMECGESNPVQVAILPGEGEQIVSQRRCDGFRAGIQRSAAAERRAVEEVVLGNCLWKRAIACNTLTEHVEKCIEPFDVVFCANDEQGMGAWDAIQQLRRGEHAGLVDHTAVYAYDAIEEAQSLIRDDDDVFRGTVVQDLATLARRLAKVVKQCLRTRKLPAKEIPPVPANLFPDDVRPRKPCVPLLDDKNWVNAAIAARIERFRNTDVLRAYRARPGSWKSSDGTFGIDCQGRKWRKFTPTSHSIRYYRPSLRRRDRPSR